jgi:hypothetical protein
MDRDVTPDRCRWQRAAITRLAGIACKVLGAAPKLHSKMAPPTTWRGMSASLVEQARPWAHCAYHEICIPPYQLCIEFSAFTGKPMTRC